MWAYCFRGGLPNSNEEFSIGALGLSREMELGILMLRRWKWRLSLMNER